MRIKVVEKELKLTDKLDKLMNEANINKVDLSGLTGIPYMTIVNFYKKGTDNIKLSTLRKLSKHFNVTLDYIVDDDELEEKGPTKTYRIIKLKRK